MVVEEGGNILYHVQKEGKLSGRGMYGGEYVRGNMSRGNVSIPLYWHSLDGDTIHQSFVAFMVQLDFGAKFYDVMPQPILQVSWDTVTVFS